MRRFLRLGYKTFEESILSRPSRALLFFSTILMLLFPVFITSPYYLKMVMYANIFAIFAASWDVLAGFAGVISLAHGVLFGVAAYAAALVNIHSGIGPWFTIPAGAVVAALVGFVIAIPSLRVKAMYFTLCSIAMPFIVSGLVFSFPNFTGGELGIAGIDGLGGSILNSYYLIAAIAIASGLIMWKVTDSRSKFVRVGIILEAIREDEIAARALGVNTVRHKFLAFAISGFFAGIAGGLYVHTIRVAGPSTLELMFAFNPLIWTIFGGIATIGGPMVGTYILYILLEFLQVIPEARMLIFACLIIFILYFMPEGIAARFSDIAEEICPRCKLVNISLRKKCRACGAPLHLERE